MSALSIFAGPTALARIREEGLNAQHIRVLLGASGDPEWFVLYGLDRYLFGTLEEVGFRFENFIDSGYWQLTL